MAYKLEKEPNGDTALVITFDGGIAPDPYSGVNLLQQIDLETPGEVAVGYPLTSIATSGATLSRPIARSTRYFPTYAMPSVSANGNEQSYAILDVNGRVWESPNSDFTGTWTFLSTANSTSNSGSLDGLAYWLGYLWKFRYNAIDYWNGSTWVVGWDPTTGSTGGTPLTADVKHFAYVATNNQLYFTNGSSVGRIFAPDPDAFDPTDTDTYSFSASILKIPKTDIALSLCEVGGGSSSQSTLLVGGAQNAIYPWDKLSTSFSLPIYVADSYIGRMVSANQNAFIFPGKFAGRGRIYITNGSQADLYYKVPDYIFSQEDPYFLWGDAIFHRNNLIFGVLLNSNSSGTYPTSYNIWGLSLEDKRFRSLTYQTTDNGRLSVGALIPIISPEGTPNKANGFGFIAGYSNDSSTAAIGYSGASAGVASSGSKILSDLIPVGTFLEKRTFTQCEYKLRTPLQSGESISVTPIKDGVAGTAYSFQPTVASGELSGVANQTIQGSQWLQLQVDLVGNSVSSGVRLKEIRLR